MCCRMELKPATQRSTSLRWWESSAGNRWTCFNQQVGWGAPSLSQQFRAFDGAEYKDHPGKTSLNFNIVDVRTIFKVGFIPEGGFPMNDDMRCSSWIPRHWCKCGDAWRLGEQAAALLRKTIALCHRTCDATTITDITLWIVIPTI